MELSILSLNEGIVARTLNGFVMETPITVNLVMQKVIESQ